MIKLELEVTVDQMAAIAEVLKEGKQETPEPMPRWFEQSIKKTTIPLEKSKQQMPEPAPGGGEWPLTLTLPMTKLCPATCEIEQRTPFQMPVIRHGHRC